MLFRVALGDVIRDHRTERLMTLREVSSGAFVALGYLSEIERGIKEPSSGVIESIADCLGVPAHTLIVETGYRMAGIPNTPEGIEEILLAH